MEVRCTRDQIEEAKESFFWKDIIRELTDWKSGFQSEQGSIVDNVASENSSTASVLLHMGSIDGRIKAVDYLLDLPDQFLHILEEQKDDSKRE
jgi:hypothetical protein